MDVARYRPGATALGAVLREIQEGDFDHAVDNFGDSAGLVADWLALTRWWRSHPPVARGSRDYTGNQPGNRSTSRLAYKKNFHAKAQSFAQRRKEKPCSEELVL